MPPIDAVAATGRWAVLLVGTATTFFVYGGGRTFDESIGPSVHGTWVALFLTAVLLVLPLVGTALLAGVAFRLTSPRRPTLIAICAAGVVATMVVTMIGDAWLGLFAAAPAGGVIVATTYFNGPGRAVLRTSGTFALGILLGAVAAETAITVDEARFFDEVERGGAAVSHDRPRAWPNGNCALVYIAGEGEHATD
jgi:hypothetical protein